MEKAGVTPGKLALVGVLALVFIGVIVCQLPDNSVTSQPATRDSSEKLSQPSQQRPSDAGGTRSNVAKDTTPPTSQAPTEQPIRTWPKLSLDRILSYDPLAAPDWLVDARNAAPPVDEASRLVAEAEREQRKEEVLRQLREQGAKVIVFSGNDKRAAIGNQSVRIGETIEGFRITDITREGVVLTELEPR